VLFERQPLCPAWFYFHANKMMMMKRQHEDKKYNYIY